MYKKHIFILIIFILQSLYGQSEYNFEKKMLKVKDDSILVSFNKYLNCYHRIYNLKTNFNDYGDLSIPNIDMLIQNFFQDYNTILNFKSDDYRVMKVRNRNNYYYAKIVQQYNGIDVIGSKIMLQISRNGNLRCLSMKTFPDINISVDPLLTNHEIQQIAKREFFNLFDKEPNKIDTVSKLCILPILSDKKPTYFLTYSINMKSFDSGTPYDVTFYIDAATGNLLKHISNMENITITVSGTANVNYWPEHYYDFSLISVCKNNKIRILDITSDEVASGYTNSSGVYSITFSDGYGAHYLRSRMEGRWIKLYPLTDQHSWRFFNSSSQVYNWTHNLSEQRNIYYHTDKIHNFFSNVLRFDDMDYQVIAYVTSSNSIGGQSDGTDMWFGTYGGYYWRRSSDVIYHEYSHLAIRHIYGSKIGPDYTQGGAMNEGFPDYFACSVNDDDISGESVGVSRDLTNTSSWNYQEDKYWNSVVISGACWDLRSSIGSTLTDELVFNALFNESSCFSDYLSDLVNTDDNDSNLANGTPHLDDILLAFYNHGIYPDNPSVPPLTPQNFSGTWYNNHPKIYWTANTEPDFDYYEVWKYNGSSWSLKTTTTNTSYIDYSESKYAGLPYLKEYVSYKVRAVDNANQKSDYTSSKQFTVNGFQSIEKKTENDSTIGSEAVTLPKKITLFPPAPNPFNITTAIKLDLPEETEFSLAIYDIKGTEIWRLNNSRTNTYPAGYHRIVWNGRDNSGAVVPTGVYFIVYHSPEHRLSRKVVLMK